MSPPPAADARPLLEAGPLPAPVTDVPAETARPLELTARAVLTGIGLGALLAVGNVYMGLKTGLWESGSLLSAVLAFSLASTFTGRRSAPFGPLENNLAQSTAAVMGAMPAAAGLLNTVPALAMLGRPNAPALLLAVWAMALGVLGVLLSHALRHRLIVKEKLPFPTGAATAEVIRALHVSSTSKSARTRAVLGAGAVSMAITWLRDAAPRWIPSFTVFPFRLRGIAAGELMLGVGWSPMLLATGAMIGPQIGLSLLLGAVLSWGVMAPWAVQAKVANLSGANSVGAWLTWPGVSLMLGAALLSLLAQGRAVVFAAKDLRAMRRPGMSTLGLRVALWLAVGACAVTVALSRPLFGVPPWLSVLALVLVLPLGTVMARAAGEADFAPVSQMGQITQVVASTAGAQSTGLNVATGGVVSSALATVGVAMWPLKAGHALGSRVRHQGMVQLFAVGMGAAVGVPVYQVLVQAYGLGTQALPAPSAVQAVALAEVTTRGLSGLPPHAGTAALVAAILGAVLMRLSRERWGRMLPSAAAMGIGFILPAHYGITMGAGALLAVVARRLWPEKAETFLPALGAGAIAGESVMGVLIAALLTAGVIAGG